MASVQRLDGWKAIGNFLGRDRTTAIRWTKERGLPVHRVPGGRTGTVYALPDELSDWLANGADQAVPVPVPTAVPAPLSRRRLLAGGALAAGVAVVGAGVWRLPFVVRSVQPTPLSAQLMNQAELAFAQGTREGQNQAVGMLQRVAAEQPGYADGWGALAMFYACSAHWRARAESETLRLRAGAAAERAEAIDPGNSFAAVARANMLATRGSWLPTEQALRRAIAAHPEHEWPLYVLGLQHHYVGRNREAAVIFERLRHQRQPQPARYYREIMARWSINRLEEADRLIDEAAQLYPGQFGIWFARLYIQMLTGRATASLAMIEDVDARPNGVPAKDYASFGTVIRALLSGAADDADDAMRVWLAKARVANGYTENAIQFAAALGRIDDAYALIDAYYFARGFVIPDVQFSVEQGSYVPLDERQTSFLFWPSMAPVRRDPRFAGLTRELGLDHYWRDSGEPPDYHRA